MSNRVAARLGARCVCRVHDLRYPSTRAMIAPMAGVVKLISPPTPRQEFPYARCRNPGASVAPHLDAPRT